MEVSVEVVLDKMKKICN